MHIKPYLGEEIGRGKSGFAANRGAVNRGFTVVSTVSFPGSLCMMSPIHYYLIHYLIKPCLNALSTLTITVHIFISSEIHYLLYLHYLPYLIHYILSVQSYLLCYLLYGLL